MKLLLLSVLFLLSIPAHAELRAEAMGGTCNYTLAGDGIWYLEKYPHTFGLTPRCGFIGVSSVSRNVGTMAVGWRVGYVDMGVAKVVATYPLWDSEHALPVFDGRGCDPETLSRCLGRGTGRQTARGLSAGYVAEFLVKDAVLGAELGGLLYEGIWTVHVFPEPAGQYKRPDYHDIEWRKWHITPYVGATLRYGYLMGMVRAYGRTKAPGGLANGPGAQALIGISVPF